VLDDHVTVLLAQEDTRGQLALMLLEALPGSGVPAHRHEHESEVFYVLEGAIDVEVCGTRRRLEAGQAAFLPAGVAHAWFVPGDGPAKALVVSTPGGIERMFEDMDWLAERGVAEPAAFVPILARHGVTLHQPEVPELPRDEDVRTD
jgi:quercetin dioxygenase-like cupin family protein